MQIFHIGGWEDSSNRRKDAPESSTGMRIAWRISLYLTMVIQTEMRVQIRGLHEGYRLGATAQLRDF